MKWLLSSGSKEDLPPEMVVGSASTDDCVVKLLMSSSTKWGKRLFIGCILIEATLIMCGCISVSLVMFWTSIYLPKLKVAGLYLV